MRDYNQIRFLSPKEKQQQSQQLQQSRPKLVKDPPSSNSSNQDDTIHDGDQTGKRQSSGSRESRQEGSTSTVLSSFSTDNSPQSSTTRQDQLLSPQIQQGKEAQHTALSTSNNKHTPEGSRAVSQDSTESTILRLRTSLDDITRQEAQTKASLAKSDSVILDLRSSIRQLKRQLEITQKEKVEAEHEKESTLLKLKGFEREREGLTNTNFKDLADSHARDARIGELQVQLDRAHAQILTADMVRKELEDTLEAEQYTWELRVQEQERLIREWQDQCRSLQKDLQECRAQWKDAEDGWKKDLQELESRLEKAQQETTHWKSMQTNSSSSNETLQLKEKLLMLEQERAELQSCLDDALKELEAVDAELQNDNSIQLREENQRLQKLIANRSTDEYHALTEPMQHLYRWLLERMDDGEAVSNRSIHDIPNDPRQIFSAIRSHLENLPIEFADLSATRKQVQSLESQLSVYRGDLKAREESSAELMSSLKEAVGLLKPLQDAASKADREKNKLLEQLEKLQSSNDKNFDEIKRLRRDLDKKDDEIDELKQKIETLQLDLSKAKLAAANTVIHHSRNVAQYTSPESYTRTREDVRSKRQSEVVLKELLRDAQSRLSNLQQQNQEVEAYNSELQGRLRQAEGSYESVNSTETDDDVVGGSNAHEKLLALHSEINQKKLRITELETRAQEYEREIDEKNRIIGHLEQELIGTKENVKGASTNPNAESILEAQKRIWTLESDLAKSKKSLQKKKENEKALKRSLKDALALLKPLQTHLEESEAEKREIAEEVSHLKKLLGSEDNDSPFLNFKPGTQHGTEVQQVRELEKTLKKLEQENSQLHDALEEVSHTLNMSNFTTVSSPNGSAKLVDGKVEVRLREDLVQLKSRYEVTQGRLESTLSQNLSLENALRKREDEEEAILEEMNVLRHRLQNTERELDNAKYIATSALVKVEELTMANVEKLSLSSSGFDHDRLYEEKARELDYEMSLIRNQGNTLNANDLT